MEYLKIHIVKEIRRQESIKPNKSQKIKINDEKILKKESFKQWLKNIRISMHLCKYRQVINEIESKKNNFKCIPEEHWRYQCIEIDAIFKILKKKILHHPKEIAKENTYQNHSCLFWLNQIFLLLEKLVLEFRPDLNKHLNYKDESIMKPIQCIIEGHIKFIFLLIVFSQYNHQMPEICSYLSIIDRFLPFMSYASRSNIYIYFQKIQLLKVKLFIENCDYLNAMESLEKNIYSCFDYIRFLSDDDFNIYFYDINEERYKKYYENLNTQSRLYKLEQEKEKEKKRNKSPYRRSIIKNNDSYFPSASPSPQRINSNNNNNNNVSKFRYNDKNLLRNYVSNSPIRNTSNKETVSNIEENNSIKIKKKESSKINTLIKNLTGKNILNNGVNESDNKKDIFLTQVQKDKDKKTNLHSQKVIEDILSNIALNFYLRASIFEHLGNIDSALDSYKEVEWFSFKFLSKKFPNFVKYMSNLLNCAWNNYNLITKIKNEKEKRKRLRLALESLEEAKGKIKSKKNMFHSASLNHFQFNKLKNNERKLKRYLDNLGKELYREEETRNMNLFSNFNKTGYILSTVKMIDNLLSDEFKNVLKKMKKVEITKQKEDIKDLINKTIIKNQKSSFVQQTIINSKISSNNDILKRSDNNNILSINIKNNFHIKKKNLIGLKKPSKNKDTDIKNNNYFYFLDKANKKFSISCRNSDNPGKHFNFLTKDINKRNKLEKIVMKNKNHSNIKDNHLNKNYFYFKQYRIGNINSKINSGFVSSRSRSHSKERVEKFPMDKENFNKTFIKKKNFLDRLCNKELNFQKNLLKTKSADREFIKSPEDFDLKKVIKDAELNFNIKFEIAKSSRRKKNLNNLIKQNYIINNNILSNRINRPTSSLLDNNNYNINEMKLKEINLDYNKIINKRNELIKRKKDIIFGVN